MASALESVGGHLESMYFTLGDYDVIAIADVPDHISATAMSVASSASGLVRTKTTPLLTIEETDQALQKSLSLRFQDQ